MIKYKTIIVAVIAAWLLIFFGFAKADPLTVYSDQYEISEHYKVCEYTSLDGLTAILIEIGT